MISRRLFRPALPALLGLAASAVCALETDQYWAWGLALEDSTPAIDAKLNQELERAVADLPVDRPPVRCDEVSAAFRARLRCILMHDLQIWAWNSRWVDRAPEGDDERARFHRDNLYSRHPAVDPGTWMPISPTIEVGGVRFGTDKLAHFVSSGWLMYREYSRQLERGVDPGEAELAAVRRAVREERTILGGMTSGVQAVADLEAGFAGMRFYRDLCAADDPVLAFDGTRWRITRPVGLGRYVTPRWDESYQPSIFSPRRWRSVRPVLRRYCDLLGDPAVVVRRREYRLRDRGSVVAAVVGDRVAAGAVADPEVFGIEAVCGVVDPSRLIGDNAAVAAGPPERPPPADLRAAVAAETGDRRRSAVGLVGLRVSYPQMASGSLGILVVSRPQGWSCRTPCDLRGPFAEIEPGFGGVALNVGWARVVGATGPGGPWLRSAYFGIVTKVTVLRTWSGIGPLPGGRTYAGLELAVPVAQANVGIGVLARTDGGDGGRWIVTGGAGWGF